MVRGPVMSLFLLGQHFSTSPNPASAGCIFTFSTAKTVVCVVRGRCWLYVKLIRTYMHIARNHAAVCPSSFVVACLHLAAPCQMPAPLRAVQHTHTHAPNHATGLAVRSLIALAFVGVLATSCDALCTSLCMWDDACDNVNKTVAAPSVCGAC
jgi:hypothetical protein